MKSQTISVFAVILVAGLMSPVARAAPFYYYFADDAANAAQNAAPEAANNAATQVQQVAGQAQDAMKDAVQQVSSGASGEAPIRDRISGHMSDLYSHGSSAMKGLVDTVQPDIKNIGKDLTDVYQQTRTQVGKRIEPLAQTVRPYIDHAQKAVAPYMTKAREEVPKAMSKVTNAVWSKIGGNQQEGKLGEQVNHATNTISKEADKAAAQEGADAAQQQENKQ